MPDELIVEGISSRIVSMNQNSEKFEGYAIDLNTGNDKNDIYYIFRTAKIENTGLSRSFIYADVNEVRPNPYLKLISTINNFKTILSTFEISDLVDHDASQPILICNLKINCNALND